MCASHLTLAVALLLAVVVPRTQAAPAGDLVDQIPGFPKVPFKIYSGYLDVPGPVAGYSSLSIHYQFHYSQRSPTSDPVVTWHQGGPGGNSLYGLYGEMGYFQVSEEGLWTHNETSWNQVANMLYLESPAGSDDPIGFSTCSVNGKVAAICAWNDTSQAVAYAHTLLAFYEAFPEFKTNPLYMSGESYAGQYVPNIANTILTNDAFKSIPLKGLLLGNACWGGTETTVQCNGPNAESNDLDNYWGKGLISNKLYDTARKTCKFPNVTDPLACELILDQVSSVVGPHNVYMIYDDCPGASEWLSRSGKTMRFVKNHFRAKLNDGIHMREARRQLAELAGGYEWPCGGIDQLGKWMARDDVRQALHLNEPNICKFDYSTSGPASITLWPFLAKNLRVLIYNGDADDCVPYKGNEEWTTMLADQGVLTEKKAWHPWYADGQRSVPAGYATTYDVPESGGKDFSFITIRLAGHMVPAFQNKRAYTFFKNFLAGTPF